MTDILQDLRYALRGLTRNPGFTTVAMLTLALGIGANVAVFSFVDAVLFRPFPFNQPDRLVMLSESHIESGQQRVGVLPGSFVDWRERSRSFEAISLLWSGPFLITNRQEPARITGATVSPNFFELIGIRPLVGRTFPSTDEEAARHEREIVISHRLWQRWFGGDAGVLGRTLEVQGSVALTIVGVMPPDFDFPRGAEIWSVESWTRASGRGDRWRQAIGRLKANVSVETATRELQQIEAQLAVEYPVTNTGWTVTIDTLADSIVGSVRPALSAMLAAVILVFLIVCVNVTTLLLLRSLDRQRELATRAALGASPQRLARQSVVECVLLAGGGVVAGGFLAISILETLIALAPAAIPRLDTIAVDLRVLGYLTFVAIATTVILGTAAALRASRVEIGTVTRGTGVGRRPGLGARGLVVSEVALAVVLLVGAGLMIRTMVNLQRVELGFNPSGVIATELRLPISRLTDGPVRVGSRPKWDRLALFYADVVAQTETLPGVRRAALIGEPALGGRNATWFARTGIVPSRADGSPEWRPIQHRIITPAYFDVLQMPFVGGRAFSEQDHALEYLRTGKGRRRGAAIVNRAAAELFWPGQNALDRTLTIQSDFRVDGRLVVGIVGDARDLAPDVEPPPTVYVPFAEHPDFGATLVTRVAEGGPPVAEIRARLRNADSLLMIGEIRPLAESYSRVLAPRRFITRVLTMFAAFGLLLSALGLYGLVAMSVAQRTREFGLRLALGSTWGRVRRMVLREALVVMSVGAALGVFVAAAGTQLLRTQLFGVETLDTTTLSVTAAILATAGLIAAWLPARRAARVDPLIALRYE